MKSFVYTLAHTLGTVLKMQGVSVLVYHSMTDDSNDPYAVTVSSFSEQMEALSKQVPFYSLDTIIGSHQKGESLTGVCVTFDDGYKSVLSVLPVLKKYTIPATVFVLSDPSHANRKELVQTEKLLTLKDLNVLLDAGVTIGSHSATHPDFSQLSESEIQSEVVRSKQKLERGINKEVKYFAYPKGRYTVEAISAVQEAGYHAAFSVAHECITADKNLFTLPRIIIDKCYQVSHFPSRISPGMQKIRNSV